MANPDLSAQREAMVERQLRARGIADGRILAAFRSVPRELFVAPDLADQAYGDHPLPIECGQTISQPYIVALMVEAAGIGSDDRVLEIGAGSGYAAAILGRLAGRVVAVERHHALAESARGRLQRLEYRNVDVVEGDGTKGWPEAAPYDAILVAASGRHVPIDLIDQLASGGRLVMPIGDQGSGQQLIRLIKREDGSVNEENLCGVRFVPLVGEDGWKEL